MTDEPWRGGPPGEQPPYRPPGDPWAVPAGPAGRAALHRSAVHTAARPRGPHQVAVIDPDRRGRCCGRAGHLGYRLRGDRRASSRFTICRSSARDVEQATAVGDALAIRPGVRAVVDVSVCATGFVRPSIATSRNANHTSRWRTRCPRDGTTRPVPGRASRDWCRRVDVPHRRRTEHDRPGDTRLVQLQVHKRTNASCASSGRIQRRRLASGRQRVRPLSSRRHGEGIHRDSTGGSDVPGYLTTDGYTYGLVQRAPHDASLAPRQLVLSFQVIDPTGQLDLQWQAIVYQFNGNYFSGVYVYGLTRASALAVAEQLGAASARHLAQAATGKPGTGGGPFQSLSSPPRHRRPGLRRARAHLSPNAGASGYPLTEPASRPRTK